MSKRKGKSELEGRTWGADWWNEDGSPGSSWITFAVFYYFTLLTILLIWKVAEL